MSSSDHPHPDIVDPLSDDPLAFLYEDGDEDEDRDAPDEHPGYSSLMGVGVRKPAPGFKPAKSMAIMLDELESQRAHDVMEINAGQLMTNPDRSNRHGGFLGLGPLDAAKEEEEEDAFAESLDSEDAEDDDWQPEDPLAGTRIAEQLQDDDDADWLPTNPLAGTEFEHTYAEDDDWAEPLPPAEEPVLEEERAGTVSAPVAEEPQFEEVEWEAPLAAAANDEAPSEAAELALPDEAAELPGDAETPVVEPPLVEAEEIATEKMPPIDWQPLPEREISLKRVVSAPIKWETLLAKRPPKKPVDLTPIDWGEFAAEEIPAEPAPAEPAPTVDAGWPETNEEAVELPVDAAEPELQVFADEEEPAELVPAANSGWADTDEEPAELPVEPAEPEWQAFTAEEAPAEPVPATAAGWLDADEEPVELPVEPAEPQWQSFAAPEDDEDEAPAPFESEWQRSIDPEIVEQPFGETLEETGWQSFAAEEPEPEPIEPEPIEIVRLPPPPPPEIPRHRIRALVMQSHQARTPPPSRVKPVAKWLGASFAGAVLPLLGKLMAWAKAKWNEIAARSPRD